MTPTDPSPRFAFWAPGCRVRCPPGRAAHRRGANIPPAGRALWLIAGSEQLRPCLKPTFESGHLILWGGRGGWGGGEGEGERGRGRRGGGVRGGGWTLSFSPPPPPPPRRFHGGDPCATRQAKSEAAKAVQPGAQGGGGCALWQRENGFWTPEKADSTENGTAKPRNSREIAMSQHTLDGPVAAGICLFARLR